MSEETVEVWRALARDRKDRRARLGVNCPVCTKNLPKAHPTILLPGQRCRVCKYRDRRVET
jgi:hypothetical protein